MSQEMIGAISGGCVGTLLAIVGVITGLAGTALLHAGLVPLTGLFG